MTGDCCGPVLCNHRECLVRAVPSGFQYGRLAGVYYRSAGSEVERESGIRDALSGTKRMSSGWASEWNKMLSWTGMGYVSGIGVWRRMIARGVEGAALEVRGGPNLEAVTLVYLSQSPGQQCHRKRVWGPGPS